MKWGSDSGCKRLDWSTSQACLWLQCCWCYCPPRERIIKEAHTLPVCLHAAAWKKLFESQLLSKANNYQQHRFMVSSNVSSIKNMSFFFPKVATDVTVPLVLTPPSAACRTDSAPPALHPPGITAPAGPSSDAPLSSSTSSLPTALPSLSRSDPGTGGGLQSRSNSSERLLEASSGASEDYHDADGTRRARAVENQYSFY